MKLPQIRITDHEEIGPWSQGEATSKNVVVKLVVICSIVQLKSVVVHNVNPFLLSVCNTSKNLTYNWSRSLY